MNKLRVGVLMGGKSIEREVSFNSGRTVCDHLDTTQYEIIPIFQKHNGNLFILPEHFLHRGKITDFVRRLEKEAQPLAWDDLKELIDFCYIAMHGRFAEDGTVQGFLEVLGIPYLGSKVFASALGMDKIVQKKILAACGILVPNGTVMYPHQMRSNGFEHLEQTLQQNNLTFPLIVKPHKEGSSLGVSVAFDKDELKDAIKLASYIHPYEQQAVLIEEKIEGMEFSCISIFDAQKNEWIPFLPTEVVHDHGTYFHDYEQKYMPGKSTEYTPARVDQNIIKKIQETCLQVTNLLGFKTISRIDGFVTKNNEIIIVDPNTLSGMGPASFVFREAAHLGMSHTDIINHLIETELYAYNLISFKSDKKMEKEKQNKISVAVLLGGNSNEREISLESGRNIVYKLSPHKYEPLALFVDQHMQLYKIEQKQLVLNSTKEIQESLTQDQKVRWNDLPKVADFVFIGLHGGLGENGSVQGTLEMLGMPYNGSSVLASSLCMDKYKTNTFLKSNGFAVPKNFFLEKDAWKNGQDKILEQIVHELSFPVIVKPHDDGCSVLVQKAHNQQELITCSQAIFEQKETALLEECITGMELTVGVFGNEDPVALPPSQTVVTKDILSIAEKFLPGAGENQTPAPLAKQDLAFVQKTVEEVYKAVGCKGYARIDCFYQNADQSPTKKTRIVIIEINTLPGMTPATCIFHQASEIGMRPMDFVDKIVQLGFEEHRKNHHVQKEPENIHPSC